MIITTIKFSNSLVGSSLQPTPVDKLLRLTDWFHYDLTQPIPLMICTTSNIYGLSLADAGLRKVTNVSALMPQMIGHLLPNRLTTHPDGICKGIYPTKNAPRIQPRSWRLHWNSWIAEYKMIRIHNHLGQLLFIFCDCYRDIIYFCWSCVVFTCHEIMHPQLKMGNLYHTHHTEIYAYVMCNAVLNGIIWFHARGLFYGQILGKPFVCVCVIIPT